jgi:membrane dipeptidase
MIFKKLSLAACVTALLTGCVSVDVTRDHVDEPDIPPAIAAMHDKLLTLDTHLDTPALLIRDGWNIDDEHSVAKDGSDVDLPRMKKGGLDGGFWVIYTRQGPLTDDGYSKAYAHAQRTLAAIKRMTAADPKNFALATKSTDAARIAAQGKRVVYLSIENATPLGNTEQVLKARMREFYADGVRMIGPVHFKNNDLADSATDTPRWKGFSPLGKAFVAEANRLGMILDASHASDDVFDQMLELSKAPIILSHSGTKALFDHPRNLDDSRLRRLAATGGVIQINSLSAYLVETPKIAGREEALKAMYAKYNLENLTAAQGEQLTKDRAAIDKKYPVPIASFEDFMAQVLHAIRVAGVDSVGIGADWDGGGGVTGMEDVSLVWRITERLYKEGYNEPDLEKIWGGNVLRVLKAVEDARDKEAGRAAAANSEAAEPNRAD